MLQKPLNHLEQKYTFEQTNQFDPTDNYLFYDNFVSKRSQDRACKDMLNAILHRTILDYLFFHRSRKEFRDAFVFLFEDRIYTYPYMSFAFICEELGFDIECFRNKLKLKFYELENDPATRLRYVKGKL